MTRAAGSQSGVALVAALFLIVVLALLGSVAVRTAGTQQQTVSLALLGARAYHAARSGVEWGIHRAVNGGACLNSSLTLTEAGLNGFDVDVSCTQSAHQERNVVINVFVITAFASAGTYGQPDYVSRRLQVTVTDAG